MFYGFSYLFNVRQGTPNKSFYGPDIMWIYHRLVFINCFISILYVGNAKYASSFVSDDNLLMFFSYNDGLISKKEMFFFC